jgi:hypothetical protein
LDSGPTPRVAPPPMLYRSPSLGVLTLVIGDGGGTFGSLGEKVIGVVDGVLSCDVSFTDD